MARQRLFSFSSSAAWFGVVLIASLGVMPPAHAGFYSVTNLVTDDQSVNSAQITDPNLVNAWGISYSGSSPFWVSDNGTGVSTLYSVNPVTNATTKLGLTVTIPGDGTPTGQVFSNVTSAFHGDTFLFVSEDGTVSGWRGALGTTAETLVAGSAANVYKGMALDTVAGSTYILGANFRTGNIDVIAGNGGPGLSGNFKDPTIPAGYAPFNIQLLGGKYYVTYALQDPAKHDDVAGAGHGFVSVFDANGNFLGRVGSQGTLDSPWGLAIAPTSFGSLAGDLLVGNFGDGHINVFNQATDTFIGQLTGANGQPIAIDGLWGLIPGNNGSAGSSQDIYFSAGPNGEGNGLFGVIQVVPEPSTSVLGLIAFGVIAMKRLCRKRLSRASA